MEQYQTIEPLVPAYSYLYDIGKQVINAVQAPNVLAQQLNTFILNYIGSRLSAKTLTNLRFWAIEFPLMCEEAGLTLAVNIIRWEPKGALETYDELLGVVEDLYDIKTTVKNANQTKKTFKIGSANVRAFGITSNRKKKTPKLGLARRGAKKDIEVNIFDEITELESEKHMSIVNQATGGGKFNVRVKISNPWVIAMWYVGQFAKALPFNEKALREQGEQFQMKYEPTKTFIEEDKTGKRVLKHKVLSKTMEIHHITNHRVNHYLSEAQHQELINTWTIDPMLARVVDLGMPGVAEGLIYAPIFHLIQPPMKTLRAKEYKAGIDWGTSTGTGGSATTLICGRIGYDYSNIAIDKEYYHSNATMNYKTDDQLIQELVQALIDYVKANHQNILLTDNKQLTVSYDWAAALLGKSLKTELEIRSRDSFQYVKLIKVQECYKYHVPIRVHGIKSIISQGRYFVDPSCEWHKQELENAMWDETKQVDGQPTRENKDDHTLDAMEYMIGTDLPKLMDDRAIKHNKLLRQLRNGV